MHHISLQGALWLLVRKGAEVNTQDRVGQTPLHVAAAKNATDCVKVLLPHLHNVNVADCFGRTALHHAAHNGHTEV